MSGDFSISDINGICRLCLKGEGTIIPIFGRENTSRDCIPLSKKIFDCVSVKVSNGDGMPSMICVGCVHQVDSWHGFKNICDSSQKKLSSWLQKTRPDIFAKNNAESRKQNKSAVLESTVRCMDVIDLSSDEDDMVQQPPLKRARDSNTQRFHKRPSSHCHNVDLLSINTNEIEILPVTNSCVNYKENINLESEESETENVSSSNIILGSSDIVPEDNGAKTGSDMANDSSDDHILPDSGMFDNVVRSALQPEESNIDINTKEYEPNANLCNSSQLPQSDDSNKSLNNLQTEETEISDSKKLTEATDSQESEISHENTSEAVTDNCDPLIDNNSNWSQSDGVNPTVSVNGIEPLNNKNQLESDEGAEGDPLTTGDSLNNTEKIVVKSKSVQEEQVEHTQDNNSSLVIGDVTSLTNHENVRIEENSRDKEDEVALTAENNSCWNQDDSQEVNPEIAVCESNNADEEEEAEDASTTLVDNSDWSPENSQDAHPAMVMCEEDPMVMNIKEEPLSACEASGDEEDPLNFQSIMIKREPEDSLRFEEEDVKPNVRQLNEALENQYNPKKLKNGKLNCEPCRVSFMNDVYYLRHSLSLRHRINLRLYRSGKCPTKKRGKALIKAVFGNTYEAQNLKGFFFCNQCPSRFKHKRNLHTHKKKHLADIRYSPRKYRSLASQELSDLPSTEEQTEESSSQLPPRQSIQNVKFTNGDDIHQCELCSQTFKTNPALVSHKSYCGVSQNRACKWCNETFTTQNLFFKHRKECLKGYKTSFNKSLHRVQELNRPSPSSSPAPTQITVPLDGTVLACTLCNLTFQSSPDLINHMQQNHMDFGKPKPVDDELPSFTKPNYYSRLKDSKLHYCKYCLRSFPTIGALSSHTGYHSRKSVYCCKFCKQVYRDKLTFRQHMKVHIGNPNLNRNVCWICYTPFSSQKDLMDHKAVHANMRLKIFPCAICGNSYNSKELLYKHRKSAHFSTQITTGLDEEQSSNVVLREEPRVQYIEEDNKLFKCRICKKRFTTLGNLKRHNLKHKPNMGSLGSATIDSFQNRCGWCFRVFKTQSGLLNHRPVCTRVKTSITNVNSVHSISSLGKSVKCKGCRKWFASQNSLYKHRVNKRCKAIESPLSDPIDPPIVELRSQNCPNCDQQFLSEESLNRHKLHCKPSIDRLTCDCGEIFSTVEMKQSHADTCKSNSTCKACSMKFNSPDELESHQAVCQIQSQTLLSPISSSKPPPPSYAPEARLPPVECSKCNKKFVYQKCLQLHLDKCLYDRWPCPNCLEIFSSETSLTTHKKSCQYIRPNRSPSLSSLEDGPTFKCEYCPARFISANELKEHSMTCEKRPVSRPKDYHSPYRPYPCDQCSKSFLWKANLYRHIKLAHRSQPGNEGGSPVSANSETESITFKCSLCPDIVFHKRQGFLEHQLAHERQGEYSSDVAGAEESGNSVLLTCELCDKKLPEALYPLHMDEHMNDDFEESNPAEASALENTMAPKFPCDVCGKEFLTPTSRKSHRATHYKTGNILAHLANKSPNKTSPKKKIKVKHIRCNICNKLLSINSMPKHKMMHRREAAEFYGENPSPTKSLSISLANTPTSSSPIVSDVPSEQEFDEDSSPTVFPCPKCDKSFKFRKMLMEHIKNHQDDSMETESLSSAPGSVDQYPYKCLFCDLSWKYKSVYERHLGSKKHIEIQKQLSGII